MLIQFYYLFFFIIKFNKFKMATVNTLIPVKGGEYLPNKFSTQDEQVSILSIFCYFIEFYDFRTLMMIDKEEWLTIKLPITLKITN